VSEPGLPIIYVRGYEGNQAGVETTVDDPFYGFNTGSTHIRVNGDGDPQFYEFESPLLRLLEDHGYEILVRGSQKALLETGEKGSLSEHQRSIWIYRFYDETSETFGPGGGRRLLIEEAAAGLRVMVDRVRETTTAERVVLVAHSMGGLICRSLIQKIYPEAGAKAEDYIDRVFTYGTPHGGIHFAVGGGLIDWAMEKFGQHGSDTFGRDRMYAFLTPGAKPDATAPGADEFDQRSLNGSFPAERFFCLVGTDPGDYGAALGLSKVAVGPKSDGLVQIENASLEGTPRAYVHRSHSGRYGEVNSEEGYQNLQRFLFGNIRVNVKLTGLALPDDGGSHQLEVRLAIRGNPVVINEQLTAHYCPIMLDDLGPDVDLFTTFLNSEKSAVADGTSRSALRLALYSIEQSNGHFDFLHHLEQVPVWSAYLVVDVTPEGDGFAAKYGWTQQDAPATPLGADRRVALPPEALTDRVFGPNAALVLGASRWVSAKTVQ
jgi:hypothetical protein